MVDSLQIGEPEVVVGADAEEYAFNPRTSADAIKLAAGQKLKIVFPTQYQLQVDIDDAAGLAMFHLHYKIVKERLGIVSFDIIQSRSGKPEHKHITVTLSKPVHSEYERIMLQTFLGSDIKREIRSWARAEERDPNPTLFYEKDGMTDGQ